MYNEYHDKLNSVYRERNHLVALISKLYPASIEGHEDDPFNPWDPEWRNVIMIDLPTGQVSWHVHDSDMDMFKHLPKFQGRKWDGYSTEEKYRRVDAMLPKHIEEH